MMTRRAALLTGLSALALAGCAGEPQVSRLSTSESEIEALAAALRGLDPSVNAEEAQRAARIAQEYPLELRVRYQVTDGPILHNVKVNNGTKPRGICVHWADDIEARLRAENFRTLELHRMISPATAFRISHSAPIISARGQSMFDGIVLDGWRNGGDLFWAPVREDTRYNWRPRTEVLRAIYEKREARAAAITE